MQSAQSKLEASYNRIAKYYVEAYFDELRRKPFDHEILDRFANNVHKLGRVCDIGCGPGHVARYLWERGVDVCGLDLSREMVAWAQKLNPSITFTRGDMLKLGKVADGVWAGIASFYSIIHLPRNTVSLALIEFWRVLHPGGQLLLAFHGGEGEVHADEWFGEPVAIDATFFEGGEMANYLTSVGFEVEEVLERPPYDFEYPSRRLYIFVRKPG